MFRIRRLAALLMTFGLGMFIGIKGGSDAAIILLVPLFIMWLMTYDDYAYRKKLKK